MPVNAPVPSDRLAWFRVNLSRATLPVLLSFLEEQDAWEPVPRAQIMAEVEAELVRRELIAVAG